MHFAQLFVCFIFRYCGKLFKLKGSLLVHERVVHGPHSNNSSSNNNGSNNNSFQCSVCKRRFTSRHRRDLHESRHGEDVKDAAVVNAKQDANSTVFRYTTVLSKNVA